MLVFGHRGASGYAPENTASAIKLALEQGADGIEIDVQLTRDGKLVVFHDWKVDRTSNGTGYIYDLDFEYLRGLDSGSWFSEEFKGEKILTLAEVFEIIPEDKVLNIEIKEIERSRRDAEKVVLEEIYKANRLDSVVVSSFHHSMIKSLHKLEPKLKLALLTCSEILDLPKYIEDNNLNSYSYHPETDLIGKKVVKELENLGIKTFVWTVNTVENCKWLESIGVHGIVTNYPDVMLEALK